MEQNNSTNNKIKFSDCLSGEVNFHGIKFDFVKFALWLRQSGMIQLNRVYLIRLTTLQIILISIVFLGITAAFNHLIMSRIVIQNISVSSEELSKKIPSNTQKKIQIPSANDIKVVGYTDNESNKKKDPMAAACLLLAGNTYNLPPAILVGMLAVEGGTVGAKYGPNKDGTYNLGPMKINSSLTKQLAKYWKVEEDKATRMVKDDPCVNIVVAAWKLRQNINDKENLTLAIAAYHSTNKKEGYAYAKKVIEEMKKMDLIAD